MNTGGVVALDRLVGVLLLGCDHTEDEQRHDASDVRLEHGQRAAAGDPHHRRRRVADHAAGATGVRRCDDRRQVTDVHLAPEEHLGHRAADHRGSDVVQEARHHEHAGEQHEAALPVVRQQVRQRLGDAALLEVIGQQRKAHQQAEQVREGDPFVAEVRTETRQPGTGLEPGKQPLVCRDRRRADEGDLERVMMQRRHSQQHEREQHEVDRNAGQRRRRCGRRRGERKARRGGQDNRQTLRCKGLHVNHSLLPAPHRTWRRPVRRAAVIRAASSMAGRRGTRLVGQTPRRSIDR